jgi:hypothetical protein
LRGGRRGMKEKRAGRKERNEGKASREKMIKFYNY